jgi:hypothetical protein
VFGRYRVFLLVVEPHRGTEEGRWQQPVFHAAADGRMQWTPGPPQQQTSLHVNGCGFRPCLVTLQMCHMKPSGLGPRPCQPAFCAKCLWRTVPCNAHNYESYIICASAIEKSWQTKRAFHHSQVLESIYQCSDM